jgi:DNA-binding beta-propeller fold protein YncE
VVATIAVGPQPRFLTAGQHALWVLNQGDGTVTRIDPRSNAVVATVDCQVPGTGGDISSGKGLVWVRAKNGRMLQTISRETNEVERIFGPLNGSGAVRVAGGLVWVTAHDINKVWIVR